MMKNTIIKHLRILCVFTCIGLFSCDFQTIDDEAIYDHYQILENEDKLHFLNEKIEDYPFNPHLYFLRSTYYYALKDWKNALVNIKLAKELNKRNPHYYLREATLYVHLNDWNKAYSSALRARKLKLYNFELISLLTRITVELNKPKNCDHYMYLLQKIDSTHHQVSFLKGLQHLNKQDTTQAIHEIKQAVEKGSKNVEVYAYLSKLYLSRKNRSEAIKYLDAGAKLDQENLDLKYTKASILFDYGLIDSAKVVLKEIVQINKKHAEANFRLAQIYHKEQKWDLTILYSKRVLPIKYKSLECNLFLGDAYLVQLDYQRAKKYYEKALSLRHSPSQDEYLREKLSIVYDHIETITMDSLDNVIKKEQEVKN